MELCVEITLLHQGMSLAYGTPGTLTPASTKMKQTKPPQEGDAMASRPTVMVFAPAVLDRVYNAIKARVAGGSAVKRMFFVKGLKAGERNFKKNVVGAPGLYQKVVFSKVQELLGGRVRIMLSGSAPLSPEVQMFVQTCFNCPLRQGYGLTETCAATTITSPHDSTPGHCGPPQENACVRLRDWPEGNYYSSDKDKPEIGMPRGEILIGGPTVTDGYYVPSAWQRPLAALNTPREEAEAERDCVRRNQSDFMTIGGIRYFCTGDIGQFTPEGTIQLIDRKKDLIKLQQGEYVALSKVENVLKSSKYTAIPLVYAHPTKSYCIALVCPQVPNLKALASSLGVQSDSVEAMCKSEEVVAAVLADLQAQCKGNRLAAFEIPQKLILVADEWSVENSMLTSTMKIKRKDITSRHMAEIDAVYT